MDIICKQCNAKYAIPRAKLPKVQASAECKRCGAKIIINTAATVDETTPTKPAAPARVAAPPPVVASAPAHDKEMLNVFPQMSGFDAARYDLSTIVKPTAKGKYKTGINKLKVKILTAVKPTLDGLLQQDEQVRHIAGGTAYYPLEIFLGNGALTMLYNRYALVATNQRLVMINTNSRMTKTRHYLYQMSYDEIKKVKRGLFRTSLALTPKQGKGRTFTGMKSALTAELLAFIEPRMDPQKTFADATQIKPHLCPSCYSRLGSRLAQCPLCQATFKTPANAALRSLLLPGLGDLYLGHRFLGSCEMIGALMVWTVALTMLLAGGTEGIVIAALLLVFVNGFDALMTLHMGKKGYTLAKKQPVVGSQPKLAASSA